MDWVQSVQKVWIYRSIMLWLPLKPQIAIMRWKVPTAVWSINSLKTTITTFRSSIFIELTSYENKNLILLHHVLHSAENPCSIRPEKPTKMESKGNSHSPGNGSLLPLIWVIWWHGGGKKSKTVILAAPQSSSRVRLHTTQQCKWCWLQLTTGDWTLKHSSCNSQPIPSVEWKTWSEDEREAKRWPS